MRRHGWALSLGLFLSGAAVAQPPADEERFPPPPDLPGEVVGQLPSPRPTVKVTDAKPETPGVSLPDVMPTPYSGTVKATVTPVDPLVSPVPATAVRRPAPCPTHTGHLSCISLERSEGMGRSSGRTPANRDRSCRRTARSVYAWLPCELIRGVGGRYAAGGSATCASGMPVKATVVAPPGDRDRCSSNRSREVRPAAGRWEPGRQVRPTPMC